MRILVPVVLALALGLILLRPKAPSLAPITLGTSLTAAAGPGPIEVVGPGARLEGSARRRAPEQEAAAEEGAPDRTLAVQPLPVRSEPVHLPQRLVLVTEVDDERLEERYGLASDEDLARQVFRINRLLEARFDPTGLPAPERARIASLLLRQEELTVERQYLWKLLHDRRRGPDLGYRLPDPATVSDLRVRHADAGREDLRVLEHALDRQRYLEESRAHESLIRLGRFEVVNAVLL